MKKRHICAVFSLSIIRFVIFALRNRRVSSANEYWFGVWAMICCWLFYCWWICLRRWMFLGIEFGRVGEWIGWFDWMRGGLGLGRRFSCARMRALVLGVLFFCCHKCHSGWNWKYFIIPKTTYRFIESDVWFCWKQRVVLLKTTYHFTENIVLFCGKWRVVLDWRSNS